MSGGRQLAFTLAAFVAVHGCSDLTQKKPHAGECADLVVFDSERGGRSDVFIMDLKSRELFNLTQSSPPGARNRFPDLSPGGSEVVFVSEDSAGVGQLYLANADGSGLRQLTFELAFYENPAWSTDGEWIAFERGSEDGWGLYAVRADGTDLHRMGPSGLNLFHPSWAQDGRRIAVVTGTEGAWVAGILSLDEDTVQVVSPPGLGIGSVKWSPDGATLALDGVVGSNFDLYLLDIESGQFQRLTRGEAVDARPEWSPDGTRLVFHSTRDRGGSVAGKERWEEFELYVLDLETGRIERVTDNEYFDAHPDWCWPTSVGAL
jgi:Tol biopolymer transport system component